MKILGKNVYIGKKCICTEFTREVDDLETLHTHEKSHKGVVFEENILFIKDKTNNFVDVNEIASIGTIALKVYGAATRWSPSPQKAGSKYIEAKPYFCENEQDSIFELKYLISVARELKDDLNSCNSL